MGFNGSIHGLRGLAAFAVVVFHIWMGSLEAHFFPQTPQWFVVSPLVFAFGVDQFFIISGFLITHSLIRHGDAAAFMRDRMIRIYPAFIPLLLILFIAGPFARYDYFSGVGFAEWLGLLIGNLIFLPGIFPMEAALNVTWSLSYEALFYIVSASAFVVSQKQGKKASVIFTIIVSVPLILFYPRAIFFVVGSGLYFFANASITSARVCGILAIPAVIVFYICLLAFVGNQFAPETLNALQNQWWLIPLAAVMGAIFFNALVHQSGPLSSFLTTRPLQFLGDISYSLYLWHLPIMFATKKIALVVASKFGEWPAFLFFGVLSVLIVLPISWLSWKYLEKGGARLFRSKKAISVKSHPSKGSA